MKEKEKTTKELIADYINEIANLKRVENLATRLATLNDIKIVYQNKAKEFTSLYAKLDAQTKNLQKVLGSDTATKSDVKRIEALIKLGQIKIDLAKKNDAINELINSKDESIDALPLENKTKED